MLLRKSFLHHDTTSHYFLDCIVTIFAHLAKLRTQQNILYNKINIGKISDYW